MTRQDYAEYQSNVAAFMEREGIRHLSTSHLNCLDCEVAFDGGTCPQCKKDAGSFAIETYPSRQPCDCCGDNEYGERYDAHSYCESTKEIKTYVICPDCEYYVEYGQLDDTTMAELEDSDESGDDS
jgi:hypothetical protein